MEHKVFEFGFVLNAVNKLSPVLSKVREQLEGVKGVVTGLAGLEVFRGASEGFEKLVESSASMQTTMARVSATTGITGARLAALREHSERFSELNFGVNAEQYAAGFGAAFQNLHSYTAAVKAADIATRGAEATGAQYTAVLDLVNAAHENFHVAAAPVVQMLAATQRRFALSGDAMDGLTFGLARMAGAAAQTHTPLAQLFAIVGESGQLLPGGRGAQLMASLISEIPSIASKAGLNMSGGILGVFDQIQQRIQGLSGEQQIQVLAQLGVDRRMGAEFIPLLNNLPKIRAATKSINSDAGAALASAVAARAQTYDAQLAIFSHSWENLKDTLGTAVLPSLTALIEKFSSLVQWLRETADRYPIIAKITLALGAMAGIAGGLAAVGAAIAIIGSGLGALGGLWGAVTAGATMLVPAISAATAAMGAFDLATLAVNPLAWAALAVAAGALVYRYWDQIKNFFTSTIPHFFAAGANLIKALAAGMLSAIMAPARAIAHVADIVRAHLPFSPAKIGPLRDLHHVQIVETIARTIRPGPAIAAMRRTAAALAISAPLIAAPMMAAPAFAARVPMASGPTGGGAAIVVNLTQEFRIEGGDPAAVIAALRAHAHEAVNIIQTELKRRERTEF
jgi:TP901 family phage tail tape measure protein